MICGDRGVKERLLPGIVDGAFPSADNRGAGFDRRRLLRFLGGSDEFVQSLKESPLAWTSTGNDLALLELILLLEGVQAILALHVGFGHLGAIGASINAVSYVLPVLLFEIAAIKLQITVTPGMNKRESSALAPAIVAGMAVGGGVGSFEGEGRNDLEMGSGG